jgi:transcriptional regulator with XRE-family HTH domain
MLYNTITKVVKKMSTLGERLRELREGCGMNQSTAAAELGITQPTLSAYENDHRLPNIRQVRKFANLYGVSVEEIIRGEDTQEPVELNDLVSRTGGNLAFLGAVLTEDEKRLLHKTLLEIYLSAKRNK